MVIYSYVDLTNTIITVIIVATLIFVNLNHITIVNHIINTINLVSHYSDHIPLCIINYLICIN